MLSSNFFPLTLFVITYCNREFEDEKILLQHQKAKHFKCHICHKKLFTGPGLQIHCLQVHKEKIERVPNSIKGRDNIKLEICGMDNIPEEDVIEHEKQKTMQSGRFVEETADSDSEDSGSSPNQPQTPIPTVSVNKEPIYPQPTIIPPPPLSNIMPPMMNYPLMMMGLPMMMNPMMIPHNIMVNPFLPNQSPNPTRSLMSVNVNPSLLTGPGNTPPLPLPPKSIFSPGGASLPIEPKHVYESKIIFNKIENPVGAKIVHPEEDISLVFDI